MPCPNQPYHYPKRILLLTVGTSPQIVTETLYKLAVDAKNPFIPHEVHIITTQKGANRVKETLLANNEMLGHFAQLCADYHLPAIAFTTEHIHLIEDTEGNFINDSESSKHNRIAADFITQTVRTFTEDDDTAVHVSLAGGRKTMSYYMGYALSLYGRMQDNLSHILVNIEFNNTDFFYPRPNNVADKEATIILSDIPYVRMRCQVPNALLEGDVGFQQTVDKIQHFNEPASIKLYFKNRYIVLNGLAVKVSPREFALYFFFCLRQRDQKPPLELDKEDFLTDFLVVFRELLKPTFKSDNQPSTSYKTVDGINNETQLLKADSQKTHDEKRRKRNKWFSDCQGKLHGKIRNKFGSWSSLTTPFEIQQVATDEHQIAYQLNIPAERISTYEEKYKK